ncbi:hypothetical protein BDF21DRAFT_483473 [Thamnidium elegans]|nr:hypothetical protein BDF21DRAFT_483473 [Thamnidium elegans]
MHIKCATLGRRYFGLNTVNYSLQNLTNLAKYKEQQPVELDQNDPELDSRMEEIQTKLSQENSLRHYKSYSIDQKTSFLYYLKLKLFKAAKAARMAGINERTGQ